MAKAPEDLVLRILRDIQATLTEHGRYHEEHKREFERIRSSFKEMRESMVTGLGLAAHANVRNDLMEDRIGNLEAKIVEIENLKARVERLETEQA
jgi:hypothetical protein